MLDGTGFGEAKDTELPLGVKLHGFLVDVCDRDETLTIPITWWKGWGEVRGRDSIMHGWEGGKQCDIYISKLSMHHMP